MNALETIVSKILPEGWSIQPYEFRIWVVTRQDEQHIALSNYAFYVYNKSGDDKDFSLSLCIFSEDKEEPLKIDLTYNASADDVALLIKNNLSNIIK